jgi:hypothetical protein
MKINYELIEKIFNRKIELKNKKDKLSLSQYSEYIPMYDIYSDMIYPINSMKLYYRLVTCHYRFITDEVRQWIINKTENATEENKKRYNDIIKILDNYDLETLEKTSYETLYRYAPEFGMSISICKRNSFNPLSTHLTPYYSKSELIKLGMNNKLIEKLTPSNLIDKQLHYSICKLVSKNDISYKTINEHMSKIIEIKSINWITYYSFTGSYLFNKILRERLPINNYMVDGLNKIMKTIEKVELPKDYYFYRFVWDDSFIKNLKIGDTFQDNGFISTTRDPFYSPGIKMDFGLILIRVNIPMKFKGAGLLMENFSMFPKEEEFLLHPASKLKLIAKDDKATYYHTNEKFEKLIRKRYEFNYIGYDEPKIKIIPDDTIPILDIHTINIEGYDRVNIFDKFIKLCDNYGQFSYNNNIYTTQWFDSTGSYEHMYKNKTKDGLIINYYMNGYPSLSIEMGEEMYVNYIRKIYLYDDYPTNQEYIDIIAQFSRIFKYKNAYIYFDYKNFTKFSDNKYAYARLYCDTIYNYYKEGKIDHSKYYRYDYGYWKLDKIGKENIDKITLNKLPKEIQKEMTWKELFIIIIEKYFYLYPRLEEWMNRFDNIFKTNYYTFNVIPYLNKNGYEMVDIPKFAHSRTFERGNMFNLIYNDNIRRV